MCLSKTQQLLNCDVNSHVCLTDKEKKCAINHRLKITNPFKCYLNKAIKEQAIKLGDILAASRGDLPNVVDMSLLSLTVVKRLYSTNLLPILSSY